MDWISPFFYLFPTFVEKENIIFSGCDWATTRKDKRRMNDGKD